MYLQDAKWVASTRDKVTTHSIYLQDPRQVASTRDKVTTHTAFTYKTSDRSPEHVTKLLYTYVVCTYKTLYRSPVYVTIKVNINIIFM